MKVSILFITYNHAPFVATAIRSAMAQDYSEFELVVCDDESSDDTRTILEGELKHCPPHIKVTRAHSHKNVGLIANFNRGMAACGGEIIIPMSGDDVSLPHRVSTIVAEFQANPKCMLVCSNWSRVDASGNPLKSGRNKQVRSVHSYDKKIGNVYAKAPICGAAAAYRTILRDTFGPMTNGHHAEDNCYWFRALLMGDIHYVPTPLVDWRSHEKNQSNWERDVDTELERKRCIRFLAVHQNFVKQWNLDLNQAMSQSLISRESYKKISQIVTYDREWQRLRRYSISQMDWPLWIAAAKRVILTKPTFKVIRKTLLSQLRLRLSPRRRRRYWQHHFSKN